MTSQKYFEMQHRHTSRCTRNFPRFINVAILGAFIILLTVIGTDKCRDLFSSTTNIGNGLKVDMNDRKKPNETTNWIEAFKELARFVNVLFNIASVFCGIHSSK
ncbi:Hypothetical predicted protein [Mytilus galloprovincialis]|uniref:Uncharacterized protein n=1 Tax=Mytilus galloprovincialis TaxID=29158 RepID=A0A8B6CPF5_MYTGA|nr:Hypothetical predicted protein [Mytilus galloprovincialis]